MEEGMKSLWQPVEISPYSLTNMTAECEQNKEDTGGRSKVEIHQASTVHKEL